MSRPEGYQTRLDHWEGAEYPDKKPRVETVEKYDVEEDTWVKYTGVVFILLLYAITSLPILLF